MTNSCYRLIVLAFTFASLARVATAQSSAEPFLTASIAAPNAIRTKLQALAESARRENDESIVAELVNTYAERLDNVRGIDLSRPVDAFAYFNKGSTQLKHVAVLPVGAEEEIAVWLKRSGYIVVDSGDGVRKADHRFATPFWFRVADEHAFFSFTKHVLDESTSRRSTTVPRGTDRADVTMAFMPGNIPDAAKQLAVDFSMFRFITGSAGIPRSRRMALQLPLERVLRIVRKLIDETERVGLQMRLDPKTREFTANLDWSAVKGSEAAKSMLSMKETANRFAGLIADDSMLTVLFSSQMAGDAALRELNATTRVQVEQLLGTSRLDLMLNVRPGARRGTLSALGALSVDDTEILDSFVRGLVLSLGRSAREIVRLDVRRIGDAKIHEIRIPSQTRAEYEPAVKQIVDNPVLVTFHNNAVYFAAGANGYARLRSALQAPDSTEIGPPFQLELAIGRLAQFSPHGPMDLKHDGKVAVTVTGGDRLKAALAFNAAELETILRALRYDPNPTPNLKFRIFGPTRQESR